jgi:hypothetical protein
MMARKLTLGLVAALGLVAVAPALVVAAACGSSGNDGSGAIDGELNLDPIIALAGDADKDAAAMEQHADAMDAAAEGRPDRARWAAEAETIRANANTLRVLASGARAIQRDPGARPGNAVELGRVYGDGRNLHTLGETLIEHADAMDAHLAAMRQEAADDPAMRQVLDSFAPSLAAMRADGQEAMNRGIELMNEVRRLAQSIGADLPPGEEHDGN